MSVVESMPWLVYPPAVDLANTFVPDVADLLSSQEQLAQFIEAERGRIPHVESAAGRLAEVREVRVPVRSLLAAAAAGRALPQVDVELVNRWSAASSTYPQLVDGAVLYRDVSRSGFHVFRAAVARSAIELAATATAVDLRTCPAPGCGMFFVRTHRRQQWCSPTCGNRGRVARHAAHRRRARDGSSL